MGLRETGMELRVDISVKGGGRKMLAAGDVAGFVIYRKNCSL